MKKVILAVTVLILMLTLTGCFGSKQNNTTPVVEPPKEQTIPDKEEMMKTGRGLWETLHHIETEISDERDYKDKVIQYIYNPGQYIAHSDMFPIYKDSKFSYADEKVYLDASGSFWYDATVTLDVFNTQISENEKLKKKIQLNFLLDNTSNTYKIKYADIQFVEKLK